MEVSKNEPFKWHWASNHHVVTSQFEWTILTKQLVVLLDVLKLSKLGWLMFILFKMLFNNIKNKLFAM